jgi:peptidoglycan/xylan/chitin deacetylase (PgdA/CDA1 family)
MNNGSFIISLDFELLWGMRDLPDADKYKKSVLGVEQVIPKMIDLFNNYNVNATFAVVGLVLCNSRDEICQYAPKLKPNYKDKNLSPYENNYIEKLSSENDRCHSAETTIEYLKEQPNIEIGTHTFCHYYCWAEGQTIEEFEADICAAVNVSKAKEITLSSIIFPRNEINDEYLKICAKHGIQSYRGNPSKFFNKKGYLNSAMRLLDTYVDVGNDTTYNYKEIKNGNYLFNIKASRFLRPYSKHLALFDNLKIRRIEQEMTRAAKTNRVYHLWWHPHNFGINQKKNLNMLEKILQHYSYLNEKYSMKSFSMNGMVKMLK